MSKSYASQLAKNSKKMAAHKKKHNRTDNSSSVFRKDGRKVSVSVPGSGSAKKTTKRASSTSKSDLRKRYDKLSAKIRADKVKWGRMEKGPARLKLEGKIKKDESRQREMWLKLGQPKRR